ncbi:MAG: hypothetical protein LBM97_02320 [Candidatus Nomurabacteria bacterium]|jgi:hypothetical protein|nr:hypothetical protein [Candidatus Nomurabacteria bacterium]
MSKRIVLVYNEQSSGYSRVFRKIVESVRGFAVEGGCDVLEYSIEPTDFDDNALRLSGLLLDGDLVIVAGGDGTATIAINAILRSKIAGARVAVFGFGNFNDFQGNFGLKPKHLAKVLHGEMRTCKVRPMEIAINGKFWRYSALYFTAGLLAKSTHVFELKKIRRNISRKRGFWRLLYSLAVLMAWFWKEVHYRKRKIFYGKLTDFGAVNCCKMARVLKTKGDFLGSAHFGMFELNLKNLWRAGGFVTRGMFFGLKVDKVDNKIWKLERPREIWLQTEGEGVKMENVEKIEVKKTEKVIEIIRK